MDKLNKEEPCCAVLAIVVLAVLSISSCLYLRGAITGFEGCFGAVWIFLVVTSAAAGGIVAIGGAIALSADWIVSKWNNAVSRAVTERLSNTKQSEVKQV